MKNVLLKVTVCALAISACFAVAGFANTDIQSYINEDALREQTEIEGVYTPCTTRNDIADMNNFAESVNSQFVNLY